MTIRVKLFAAARQSAGADEVDVQVVEPASVAALRAAMAEQFPNLAGLLRHAMFAVNAEYVAPQTIVAPSDEVACIPPVSGG